MRYRPPDDFHHAVGRHVEPTTWSRSPTGQWIASGPPCERCGAPHHPGMTFGRWCRGRCELGSASRGLLILSCSATKHPSAGPAPAWSLYDGILFRVCKRLQHVDAMPDVGIRILSARYGLLRPTDLIEPYDVRMDRERAEHMKWLLNCAAPLAVYEEDAGEVYLAMGRTYRLALPDRWFPAGVRLIDGGGAPGVMQARLHAWLAGYAPPSLQPSLFDPPAAPGPATADGERVRRIPLPPRRPRLSPAPALAAPPP
jgi:hypothetical protein